MKFFFYVAFKNFIVLALTLKFLIHFQLIILYVAKYGLNFIFSYMDIKFFQHHLWGKKALSFPH